MTTPQARPAASTPAPTAPIFDAQAMAKLLSALPGVAYECSVAAPWTIQYISAGVRGLSGYDADVFTSGSMMWGDVVHPDDLERIAAQVDAAVAERRQFTLTYRLLCKLGEEKWVLERGEAVYDPQGEAVSLIGFIGDITEQKHTEQRLLESEAEYCAARELSALATWSADPDGNILEVGARWLDAMGLTQEETLAGGWIDLLHPHERQPLLEEWSRCLQSGESFDQRHRVQLPAGDYRWFRSRAAPKQDAAGNVIRWYGTTEDIHKEVCAETQLQEAERRYALAAQAANVAVWDWDLASGAITWTGAITRALGYRDDQVGGDYVWWRDRIHTDDTENVVGSIQAAIEDSVHLWSGEYRFRRADGTYSWIFDQGYIVRNHQGAGERMVGAMHDISERRAAQSAVHRLQAELIQVSRLSAMGTIASTLAHELNQPLTAALNWMTASQRLLGRGPDCLPRASEGFSQAHLSVEKAGEIIKRVRKMVATGEATTRKEDLRSIVKESMMLTSELARQAGVTCRVKVPAISVEADRIQLQQVLLNLIRNAIEAMDTSARKELEVSARTENGCAEVSVADTGPGIKSEGLSRLFTPYLSTKDGGLGLGLSVCRTIVEAHQGKMWVDEHSEGGAIFRFTIPVADPATQ